MRGKPGHDIKLRDIAEPGREQRWPAPNRERKVKGPRHRKAKK